MISEAAKDLENTECTEEAKHIRFLAYNVFFLVIDAL